MLFRSMLPAAIPSYLRTGASVTNDSLLSLLGAVLLYELCRVIAGDLSRKTAIRAGIWWGLMLLTKGIALILPPVIVVAYLVGASGALRNRIRTAVLPCLTAGITGFVLGGWWYIRNLVDFGAVQPRGKGPDWPPTRLYGFNDSGTTTGLITTYIKRFAMRFFGSLGLIDRPGWPRTALWALFAVLLVLLVLGVVAGVNRASAPRWGAIALILPATLCFLSIPVKVRHTYLITNTIPGIQIRYLNAFLSGLAIVAAVALVLVLRRVGRWLTALVYTLIALFQIANVVLLLDQQFGSSTGTIVHRIDRGVVFLLRCSPYPDWLSVVIVLVTAAIAIWTLVALLRHAGDHADPDSSGEPAAGHRLAEAVEV